MTIRLIDTALLRELSAEARSAPRRRKNYNFHPSETFPAHRLLNAVEPSSYVPPHRHLSPMKGETLIVLKGKLGLIELDEAGEVRHTTVLSPGGDVVGCDVPHGTFHTVVALSPGTVFFEAKAGPYEALSEDERAPWAPLAGTPEAEVYLARMCGYFL